MAPGILGSPLLRPWLMVRQVGGLGGKLTAAASLQKHAA